jgi:hypothetical protein
VATEVVTAAAMVVAATVFAAAEAEVGLISVAVAAAGAILADTSADIAAVSRAIRSDARISAARISAEPGLQRIRGILRSCGMLRSRRATPAMP